jgi:hypothetical protein
MASTDIDSNSPVNLGNKDYKFQKENISEKKAYKKIIFSASMF